MLIKKPLFFVFILLIIISGLNAQAFPAGNYWSLGLGLGMSDMLVDGSSFQGIIEPRLWISKPLMTGARFGVNYSNEDDGRDILTLETQVYLRWNFLRFGKDTNPVNVFVQGGVGILASYRGNKDNPNDLFGDVKMPRGSVLGDVALGITIPFANRWYVEPQVRAGYPHIWGVSLTAGIKFPLPESTYKEVISSLPPTEIIKRLMISSVEYVIFAGDIGRYNVGIDRDAQGLNELVLNSIAQFLKDNPDCVVRIDGHANPITQDPKEAEELAMLSRQRALAVAEQLKERGITDDQMVIIYHGGTKTVIPQSDTEHRNRNRRVELVLIHIDNIDDE